MTTQPDRKSMKDEDNRSPAVDAYIEAAPSFAQPILLKLRALFHQACPHVVETIKWRMPFFEHKGVLAGVAAHKKHVNLFFWKGRLMQDAAGLFPDEMSEMSPIRFHEGDKLASDRILLGYILQAVQLNESGAKLPPRKPKAAKSTKLEVEPPAALVAGLAANKQAKAAFAAFSPSHRREYIEWIASAKRQETRDRRIAQAVKQIAAGKSRDWKYDTKS